jgi:phospholipid/cholesterol/gamma-HCH transport system permease protein
VEGLGRLVLDSLHETGETIAFVGRITLSIFWSLRHPRRVRWGEIAFLVQRSGAEALPIVTLLSLLVGLVTAFSAAVQLRQFGADIFIADLVGIGMTRELGPLMAAILLTGRSGSAFAAEIGTMRISDEIDALTVMGIRPLDYLVMPRIFAVMLALPLLSLYADLAGIAGGMAIAGLSLDLTPAAFFGQLRKVVEPWDVMSGVLKSVIFGLLVAGVGCHRGLRTEGGALGVGRSTTASVVSGIFLIVAADSVFVILFHYLGLE